MENFYVRRVLIDQGNSCDYHAHQFVLLPLYLKEGLTTQQWMKPPWI